MERLIEVLVDSKSHPSPARIEEIQKEIQRLQRQPTGWEIGLALLTKNDSHFRFYGALTLTVKIRTDWNVLETQPELRNVVLTNLIGRYVELTNQLEQAFVLRKVCSTLAAFYLQPNAAWQLPVRQILISFCYSHIPAEEPLDDFHRIWAGLVHAKAPQLRSTLWLGISIAEEVLKLDASGISKSDAQLAKSFATNALDVWWLIYVILRGLHVRLGFSALEPPLLPDYVASLSKPDLLDLSNLALETASTWIKAHASWELSESRAGTITSATVALIARCFFVPQIADNTISCLKAIVEETPKYLTNADDDILLTLIDSKQAGLYITTLLQGAPESEALLFVEFLGSLMDLHDLSTPQTIESPIVRAVIGSLRSLLYIPSLAVVVDESCQTVLDAFNQIADGWSGWVGSSSVDQFLGPIMREACLQLAIRIEYPPQHSDFPAESWEADERARFQEFRHDVQDLLLSTYACVGPDLIKHLAAPLHASKVSPGWEDFEAQLFCLATFSDVIVNEPGKLGKHTSDVFASQKWNLLTSNVQAAPERARQGAIHFISRNADLLQHDVQHLLSCMNSLFSSLHLHGSTLAASRAILTLCYKQRFVLVDVLPRFIESISALPDIPCEDRHRLFSGVAAIVQAISPEELKVAPLEALLSIILQASAAKEPETNGSQFVSGVDMLAALAAVGKGLRDPAESPINIDSEPAPDEVDFWIYGGGKHVQQALQGTVDRVLTTSPIDSRLIEAVCEMMKAGYTEVHPSPFKLVASYNASLLARLIHIDCPSVGLVIDTASAFVASQSSDSDSSPSNILQIASAMSQCQRALLQSFAITNAYDDHEFTYSSLDFFARMLPRFPDYFADENLSQSWQLLFEFALLPLQNADILPRRSAAQFWAAIFDLSASISGEEASQNLQKCLQYFGPRFTLILLRLLGGEAARSELDVLSETLKEFVGKQGLLAGKLLREAALVLDGGDGKTKRFVAQIIALRSATKTRQIVKNFWIEAKGTAFAYAG